MNFLDLFEKKSLIGAHRGDRVHCAENTLSALEGAKNRCDFIEIDTQLSKDGIAIIMHDATLERTTNVTKLKEFAHKKPFRVCDFTLKELEKLDYGTWFKGVSEPLLTLHQALKFIKQNRLFLNLEIKDMYNTFEDTQVIQTLMQEIHKTDTHQQLLISSFRHQYLKLCKPLPTAALVENKHPHNLVHYLKNLKVDAYHFNKELVCDTNIKHLRESGFFINIYTLNDPNEAKELFSMGVNGIFTDDLDKMASKRYDDANL